MHAEVHTVGHIFIWGTELRKGLWYSWTEVASRGCWRHFRRQLALPIVYFTDSKLFPKWEELVHWQDSAQALAAWCAEQATALAPCCPRPVPRAAPSPAPWTQPPVKHHGQKSLWCCWGRAWLCIWITQPNCAGFQAQLFKSLIFV